MEILLKLLILSGKHMSRLSVDTILEAYKRSVVLGNQLCLQYEHALDMVGDYNNIQELYNENFQESIAYLNDGRQEVIESFLKKLEDEGKTFPQLTSEDSVVDKSKGTMTEEEKISDTVMYSKNLNKYTSIIEKAHREHRERINTDSCVHIPNFPSRIDHKCPDIPLKVEEIKTQKRRSSKRNSKVKLTKNPSMDNVKFHQTQLETLETDLTKNELKKIRPSTDPHHLKHRASLPTIDESLETKPSKTNGGIFMPDSNSKIKITIKLKLKDEVNERMESENIASAAVTEKNVEREGNMTSDCSIKNNQEASTTDKESIKKSLITTVPSTNAPNKNLSSAKIGSGILQNSDKSPGGAKELAPNSKLKHIADIMKSIRQEKVATSKNLQESKQSFESNVTKLYGKLKTDINTHAAHLNENYQKLWSLEKQLIKNEDRRVTNKESDIKLLKQLDTTEMQLKKNDDKIQQQQQVFRDLESKVKDKVLSGVLKKMEKTSEDNMIKEIKEEDFNKVEKRFDEIERQLQAQALLLRDNKPEYYRLLRQLTHKLLEYPIKDKDDLPVNLTDLIPLPMECDVKIDKDDLKDREQVMKINKQAFDDLERSIEVVTLIKNKLEDEKIRDKAFNSSMSKANSSTSSEKFATVKRSYSKSSQQDEANNDQLSSNNSREGEERGVYSGNENQKDKEDQEVAKSEHMVKIEDVFLPDGRFEPQTEQETTKPPNSVKCQNYLESKTAKLNPSKINDIGKLCYDINDLGIQKLPNGNFRNKAILEMRIIKDQSTQVEEDIESVMSSMEILTRKIINEPFLKGRNVKAQPKKQIEESTKIPDKISECTMSNIAPKDILEDISDELFEQEIEDIKRKIDRNVLHINTTTNTDFQEKRDVGSYCKTSLREKTTQKCIASQNVALDTRSNKLPDGNQIHPLVDFTKEAVMIEKPHICKNLQKSTNIAASGEKIRTDLTKIGSMQSRSKSNVNPKNDDSTNYLKSTNNNEQLKIEASLRNYIQSKNIKNTYLNNTSKSEFDQLSKNAEAIKNILKVQQNRILEISKMKKRLANCTFGENFEMDKSDSIVASKINLVEGCEKDKRLLDIHDASTFDSYSISEKIDNSHVENLRNENSVSSISELLKDDIKMRKKVSSTRDKDCVTRESFKTGKDVNNSNYNQNTAVEGSQYTQRCVEHCSEEMRKEVSSSCNNDCIKKTEKDGNNANDNKNIVVEGSHNIQRCSQENIKIIAEQAINIKTKDCDSNINDIIVDEVNRKEAVRILSNTQITQEENANPFIQIINSYKEKIRRKTCDRVCKSSNAEIPPSTILPVSSNSLSNTTTHAHIPVQSHSKANIENSKTVKSESRMPELKLNTKNVNGSVESCELPITLSKMELEGYTRNPQNTPESSATSLAQTKQSAILGQRRSSDSVRKTSSIGQHKLSRPSHSFLDENVHSKVKVDSCNKKHDTNHQTGFGVKRTGSKKSSIALRTTVTSDSDKKVANKKNKREDSIVIRQNDAEKQHKNEEVLKYLPMPEIKVTNTCDTKNISASESGMISELKKFVDFIKFSTDNNKETPPSEGIKLEVGHRKNILTKVSLPAVDIQPKNLKNTILQENKEHTPSNEVVESSKNCSKHDLEREMVMQHENEKKTETIKMLIEEKKSEEKIVKTGSITNTGTSKNNEGISQEMNKIVGQFKRKDRDKGDREFLRKHLLRTNSRPEKRSQTNVCKVDPNPTIKEIRQMSEHLLKTSGLSENKQKLAVGENLFQTKIPLKNRIKKKNEESNSNSNKDKNKEINLKPEIISSSLNNFVSDSQVVLAKRTAEMISSHADNLPAEVEKKQSDVTNVVTEENIPDFKQSNDNNRSTITTNETLQEIQSTSENKQCVNQVEDKPKKKILQVTNVRPVSNTDSGVKLGKDVIKEIASALEKHSLKAEKEIKGKDEVEKGVQLMNETQYACDIISKMAPKEIQINCNSITQKIYSESDIQKINDVDKTNQLKSSNNPKKLHSGRAKIAPNKRTSEQFNKRIPLDKDKANEVRRTDELTPVDNVTHLVEESAEVSKKTVRVEENSGINSSKEENKLLMENLLDQENVSVRTLENKNDVEEVNVPIKKSLNSDHTNQLGVNTSEDLDTLISTNIKSVTSPPKTENKLESPEKTNNTPVNATVETRKSLSKENDKNLYKKTIKKTSHIEEKQKIKSSNMVKLPSLSNNQFDTSGRSSNIEMRPKFKVSSNTKTLTDTAKTSPISQERKNKTRENISNITQSEMSVTLQGDLTVRDSSDDGLSCRIEKPQINSRSTKIRTKNIKTKSTSQVTQKKFETESVKENIWKKIPVLSVEEGQDLLEKITIKKNIKNKSQSTTSAPKYQFIKREPVKPYSKPKEKANLSDTDVLNILKDDAVTMNHIVNEAEYCKNSLRALESALSDKISMNDQVENIPTSSTVIEKQDIESTVDSLDNLKIPKQFTSSASFHESLKKLETIRRGHEEVLRKTFKLNSRPVKVIEKKPKQNIEVSMSPKEDVKDDVTENPNSMKGNIVNSAPRSSAFVGPVHVLYNSMWNSRTPRTTLAKPLRGTPSFEIDSTSNQVLKGLKKKRQAAKSLSQLV